MPRHEVKRRVRAAAEARAKQRSNSSGNRLGGRPTGWDEDIREVIVNAVQRRTNITKGCASDSNETGLKNTLASQALRNGFRTPAGVDNENERAMMESYMELVQEEEREKHGPHYEPPSHENPMGRGTVPGQQPKGALPPSIAILTKPVPGPEVRGPLIDLTTETAHPSSSAALPEPHYSSNWICEVCTMENPSTFLCCDACGVERPSPPPSPDRPKSVSRGLPEAQSSKDRPGHTQKLGTGSAYQRIRQFAQAEQEAANKMPTGWMCHQCDTFMEIQWWTCTHCGAMKLSS